MNAKEIHRITGGRAIENLVLELTFSDGYVGRIDLNSVLWGPAFESLRDPTAFRQFRIEDDTIRWPNGADFCPNVLRFWCEMGGVRTQEETDAYFRQQLGQENVADEPELASP